MSPSNDITYVGHLQDLLREARGEREAASQDSSSPHLQLRRAFPGQYSPGERKPDVDDLTTAEEAGTERVVAAAGHILDGDIAERAEVEALDEGVRAEIGVAWAQLSPQAQSSLLQGDRLRLDTKRFAEATGIPGDFALPVFAYCRTLEIELYRRIFLPFKDFEGPTRNGWKSEDGERSAEMLEQFQTAGRPLGMGQMAACLANLGCGEAGVRHVLASFLRGHLVDATEFCASRYPRWLKKLALGYRNRAAHISSISESDCEKARAYLLSEPRRLLLALVELAPAE